MAFKNVILFVLLAASVVKCLPRDSTAVHRNNDIDVVRETDSKISESTEYASHAENEVPSGTIPSVTIPGRIGCPHDEATEDEICLEHCLPKGYSYGLCISKTCSCI